MLDGPNHNFEYIDNLIDTLFDVTTEQLMHYEVKTSFLS